MPTAIFPMLVPPRGRQGATPHGAPYTERSPACKCAGASRLDYCRSPRTQLERRAGGAVVGGDTTASAAGVTVSLPGGDAMAPAGAAAPGGGGLTIVTSRS